MREMIDELRQFEDSIGAQMVQRFQAVFSATRAPGVPPLFLPTRLEAPIDLLKIWKSRGFYVILTDRSVGENACTFTESGLRAIYRGHADKVHDRVSSHLDRTAYEERAALPWDRCMKIPGGQRLKGGITFYEAPFCDSKWSVVVLPLPNSTAFIRKHAEYAFDDIFGKPTASAGERSSRRV